MTEVSHDPGSVAAIRRARLASLPLEQSGPKGGFVTGTGDSIRSVWRYRELLQLLVKRELKSRYKDSVLGFLWSLLRPLTLLLVYYLAIGKFLGAERSTPSFAIFMYAGLTAWGLFSEIVASGTSTIVANGGLVKKIYLPREIFPLATIGSALFNFAVQLLILVAATFIAQEPPNPDGLLYVVAGIGVLLTWAGGWAFLLSAANVYLRDITYLVEIVLMFGFWLSPIVYTWKQVSSAIGGTIWGDIYLANPITIAVFAFQRGFWRAGLTEPQPSHLGIRLAVVFGVGLLLLWLFQRIFVRMQGNFAQEL